MDDAEKSRAELLSEINALRRRVEELEREALDRRADEPTGALALEVADHRRTAETLRELGIQYRALFNAGFVGVFTAYDDGIIHVANDAFLEMIGRTRQDLAAAMIRWSDIRAPELDRIHGTAVDQLRHLRAHEPVEQVFLRADGARVPVLVAGCVITPGHGVCFVLDLTEHKRTQAALAASERRYRRFYEFGLVAMAELDAGDRWIDVNDRLCEFLGCPRERLIGRAWDERAHPEDRRALRNGGRPSGARSRAIRFVRPGGQIVHAEVAIETVANGDGTDARGIVVIQDVTAHKRAEAVIRQEEARLRRLMNSIPFGVTVVSAGTTAYVNPALCELLGRDADALLGTDPVRFLRAPGSPRRGSASRGGRYPHGYTVTRPDGTTVAVEVFSQTIEFEGRDSELTVVKDVEHRRRIEQEIREGERRLRRITDAVPGAVFKTCFADDRWHFEFISGGVEALFGLSVDEVLADADALWSLVTPEDADDVRASMSDAWALRGSWSAQFRARVGNGEVRWIGARASLALKTHGEPAWYGIFEDVTELRALEEHVRQGVKMEAIGRLAGGIAHDFNNILATIRGYTKLLSLDVPPASELAESVAAIDACVRRGSDLTHQLLIFARERSTRPQLVELNRVVRDLESMYRRLIGGEIDIITSLHDGPTTVHIDPSQLEQVVMNLVVNAREAMAAGGNLYIETCIRDFDRDTDSRRSHEGERGRHVELVVSDTGAGIQRELLPRIFEPFFTTKSEGSGLGLATIFGIIRGAGGSITVESQVGEGTKFTVLLPLAEGSPEAPTSP